MRDRACGMILVVLLVNLSSSLVYFITPTELVESEKVKL